MMHFLQIRPQCGYNPPRMSSSPPSPSRWFRHGFGKWVAREEARLIRQTTRLAPGRPLAVQLAAAPIAPPSRRNPRQIAITSHGGDLRADWRELPFPADSLDLVILIHALESSPAPRAVLREAVRILRPEGRLVIVGFNRHSLLSLSRTAPWRNQWMAVGTLNSWLDQSHMHPIGGEFAVFLPPWRPMLAPRWRWWELAGRRWWPLAGGVYALHTVKRRPGMRLILPSPRLAAATQKPAIAALKTPQNPDTIAS